MTSAAATISRAGILSPPEERFYGIEAVVKVNSGNSASPSARIERPLQSIQKALQQSKILFRALEVDVVPGTGDDGGPDAGAEGRHASGDPGVPLVEVPGDRERWNL